MCFYGRFLTAINITAPTTAIAAIIAIAVPMKYISVGGNAAAESGVAVGAVIASEMCVSADEP